MVFELNQRDKQIIIFALVQLKVSISELDLPSTLFDGQSVNEINDELDILIEFLMDWLVSQW